MSSTIKPERTKKVKRATLPARSPRIWHGMTAGVWFPLLWRGKLAVSPSRVPMACAISMASLLNSSLRLVSEAIYSRRASAIAVKSPVFVIGHWRTGTTFLHELLIQDTSQGYPTTFQCMAPHHFLLTDMFMNRWFNWLLPKTRPMDNMPIGFERPQEDEFALVNVGLGSPYLEWAFPNLNLRFDEYLSLEELDEREREAWKDGFVWFVKRLSLSCQRTLILKSPTHTARVPILLELFPDARFIHIVRNPLTVVPSTKRTWEKMTDSMSLQVRREAVSMDRVLDVFDSMYGQFEATRGLIPAENYHELRYEDLIENPLAEVESIYQKLNLGDFEQARPAVQEHLDGTQMYRPNRYEFDDQLSAKIKSRCEAYMKKYGYWES